MSTPPSGSGGGRHQGMEEDGVGNPFWSQRAREEHELAQARPRDLPAVETPNGREAEEYQEGNSEELPPVEDEKASEELRDEGRGGLTVTAGWPQAGQGGPWEEVQRPAEVPHWGQDQGFAGGRQQGEGLPGGLGPPFTR